jgi:hypothetical protein
VLVVVVVLAFAAWKLIVRVVKLDRDGAILARPSPERRLVATRERPTLDAGRATWDALGVRPSRGFYTGYMSEKGCVFEKSGSLVAGTSLGGTQVVTLAPELFAQGYRRALQRFRQTWNVEEPRKWFFPLFEALNWSVALADNLRSVGTPLDAPVVVGLRFVRNRVHHQWAQALEPRRERNAGRLSERRRMATGRMGLVLEAAVTARHR